MRPLVPAGFGEVAYRRMLASQCLGLFLLTAYGLRLTVALAVEVEPARLELTIPADQPSRGTLEITNRAARAVQVQIGTGPYRFLQPGVSLASAENWLSFEPSRFTLAPSASTQVEYLVTPPANVPDDTTGEYLAAILVDELPARSSEKEAPPEGAKITVVPRLALPVYLKIRGRERIQVEVTELRVQAGQSPGVLRVDTTLVNRGTVHVRPTGTLAILQSTGGLLHAGSLGKALPLLPTATLQIPTVVPLPPPGRYRAIITVEAAPETLIQKEATFEVTPAGKVQ